MLGASFSSLVYRVDGHLVGGDLVVSTIAAQVISPFCLIPTCPSRMGQTKQYLDKKQMKPGSTLYDVIRHIKCSTSYQDIIMAHSTIIRHICRFGYCKIRVLSLWISIMVFLLKLQLHAAGWVGRCPEREV